MKKKIRKLFMFQPFLYFLWYKLYRSKRGLYIKWFDDQTEFYFDGYPRSGNTFMLHLMNGLYDNKKIIHHFHAIAPLKIAFKKDVKSIIIIRDPLESVPSNYLKRFENSSLPSKVDSGLLEQLLIDYIEYYKFIHKNRKKIFLVSFKNLIEKPEDTLFKIDLFLDNLSGIDDEKILREKVSIRKNISFGAKSKLGSSLPSKEKEKLKFEIKQVLSKQKSFKEAQRIFINLI